MEATGWGCIWSALAVIKRVHKRLRPGKSGLGQGEDGIVLRHELFADMFLEYASVMRRQSWSRRKQQHVRKCSHRSDLDRNNQVSHNSMVCHQSTHPVRISPSASPSFPQEDMTTAGRASADGSRDIKHNITPPRKFRNLLYSLLPRGLCASQHCYHASPFDSAATMSYQWRRPRLLSCLLLGRHSSSVHLHDPMFHSYRAPCTIIAFAALA